MVRCPLCAGFSHSAMFGIRRCTLCSLVFVKDKPSLPPMEAFLDNDGTFRFTNWNSWRTKLTRRLPLVPEGECYFSPLAVRMFAGREGYQVTGLESRLPLLPGYGRWERGTVLRVRLAPMPLLSLPRPDTRVTLGIIAAADAGLEVLALWRDCQPAVADIVVVLDTANAAQAAALQAALCEGLDDERRCQVIAQPLRNDYAAQRNLVQQTATTAWVLQLDCDERLTAQTKAWLSSIVDDAEQAGWAVIGLTRRNVVDGIAAALYPDVQYRLLRRTVAFTRVVHEYPVLGPGQRSFVHLGAGLIHSLDGQRLAGREVRYEGIAAGAGRPYDTALLRQPLEASVSVTP